MPAAASPSSAPLVLVWGGDEFAVRQRAREIYRRWCEEAGGMDHEIIDASVSNSGEALHALARLREALQTLPFFGTAKVVWLRDCNFLGDERAAGAAAVTESLADLAQELKAFTWTGVRLLVSAGKIDKRKTFYKTLEKIATVESFAGWSMDDRDWAMEAENAAARQLRSLGKEISAEALARLITCVGPNARQLHSETEKLALYAGDRAGIEVRDVDEIVTRNKQSRAFALGDALGDRDLPRALRVLDQEMWEMKFDRDKSEIGILYGLISKVRMLILAGEMARQGWLKPARDFNSFRSQLDRVPAGELPGDKRFNPLAMSPYVLFKASAQVKNYSQAELIRAMEMLLESNQRLISRALDGALVLQQALVGIISRAGTEAAARAA